MNDIALITGTSSGMGLHAAVELARRGLHVVATMRDTGKAGALRDAAAEAGVEVDVRALDVVDHAAAARLVAEIEAELGGIRVLVNNAGQGNVATAEQLTMEQIQAQLDINYLAPVNLAKLVLPGMRERGNGRILTVTSVGGAVGQPFADAYCGAKFAVEGFMQSLAVVAERFGVGISVIEPAAVASAFVENAIRPESGGPYGSLLDAYIVRSTGAFANAQSAESAGAAIAAAVLSDEYRFRWQSSEGATRFVGVSLADTDGSGVLGFTRSWIAAG
ncbi:MULTISPECIES: SDR family NAD(P)-dependent oxidoreductase [unclassified Microbacterium]|uniref:SDR family NAD(P)-dependent oxidoreductase n=1 Tax=unclassified Microbacterium TaxID=2609290 RepID=UPI000493328A|nr:MULTISPECIES: SDR family NAD(P)-dependent oxidoreductase [unclassified Microbacterium]MCV0334054.1 SDR family NAD(P)-dependent oxidoreductase [Microbacterium sp.]MCV0374418.1 SDR family NAD(P)-dependent oxidoreductase [Microbacterium sp.]MCV0389490.1 SDR family NAD(P)-dependent oxidoreductase [Microbacterium sp.]MCV0419024.1 SDR family NAD(P)-dependent oxidoreductase [Microbacterium sp.]MCV0421330.1 SDR family NAD(P)-dependent oxidoreductase [Microbacterium sp.]